VVSGVIAAVNPQKGKKMGSLAAHFHFQVMLFTAAIP
jgi:hypothetical protein